MSGASLVLIALLAQAAQAEPGPASKVKAQILLAKGVALYERGEMAPALEKFQEAYAWYPSPKLLFNIGQASREVGRFADAMEAFERFLAQSADAPSAITAEAQQSVASLRAKLGRLSVVCATAEVEIRVDGRKLDFSPPSHLLWVMPGNHQVTARYPDVAPFMDDVDVPAGEVRTSFVQLQIRTPIAGSMASVVPTAASTAAAALPVLPAVSAARGWWLGRKWTWIAAGGAVAFTASAVAFGLTAQSKFDSLDKSCGNGSPAHLGCSQSDIDSVRALKNTTNVLWGLAGAATVTAGILFYVEGRPVSVAPMTGAAIGLVTRTEF
jgi:tetratricopeptide (TPR) repeat protein